MLPRSIRNSKKTRTLANLLIISLTSLSLLFLLSINLYGFLNKTNAANTDYEGSFVPISSIKIDEDTATGANSVGTLDTGDNYGISIDTISDLDGNLIDDLVVGAAKDEGETTGTAGSGAVYVHYMGANNQILSSLKLDEDTVNGASSIGTLDTNDSYGWSVEVSDIDKNGYEDILVGAYGDEGETTGTASSGAVYIHLMTAGSTIQSTLKLDEDTVNGASSIGTLDASDNYGTAIAVLDDYDNNGYKEIAVGAQYDEGETTGTNFSGAVYIHFIGPGATILSTLKLDEDTVNGANSVATLGGFDSYGSAIVNIGDIDDNNYDDILVGAPGYDSSNGAMFLHYMAYNGSVLSTKIIDIDEPNGATSFDGQDGSQYGNDIAVLGDLDNNGYDDIAVGAVVGSGEITATDDTGAVYIHHMGPSGTILRTSKLSIDTPNGSSSVSTVAYTEFYGSSITSLGDTNNDGVIDLAIGSRDEEGEVGDTATSGAFFIHTSGYTPYLQYFTSSTSKGTYTKNDLIDISAVYSENLDPASTLEVLLNTGQTVTLDSVSGNTISGGYIVGAGEYTGDLSVTSITSSSVISSNNGTKEQNKSIDHITANIDDLKSIGVNGGSPSLFNVISNVIHGEGSLGVDLQTSDGYGESVALMGDLDGNGIADIAVGAPQDEAGGTSNVGAVYIHLLDTDGSILDTTVLGEGTTGVANLENNDRYGYNLISLGDVDGNGVNDIAITALFDEIAGSDHEGAIYIHLLGSSGVGDLSVLSGLKIGEGSSGIPSMESYAYFGESLVALGDVDGNGTVDFLSGGENASDEADPSYSGAVYVHLLDSTKVAGNVSLLDSQIFDVSHPDLSSLDAGDSYGYKAINLDDLDGDGFPEILVSAIIDENGATTGAGAAYIHFLDSSGVGDVSFSETFKIGEGTTGVSGLDTNDRYGFNLAKIGTIDGKTAIAINATFDETASTTSSGVVYLHLLDVSAPDTLTVSKTTRLDADISSIDGLESFEGYGDSIASLGDIDGNGVPDIMVSCIDDENIAADNESGSIYIHLLDDTAEVIETFKLGSTNKNLSNLDAQDGFGKIILPLPDLDSNGFNDYLVTANNDETSGSNNFGTVMIHFANYGDLIEESIDMETSTKLVITYPNILDSSSIPDIDDFTLKVDSLPATISNVSVLGTEVTLTLANPITTNFDRVQLTYLADTNPIQNTFGLDANNIINQLATVNIFKSSSDRAGRVRTIVSPGGSTFTGFILDSEFQTTPPPALNAGEAAGTIVRLAYSKTLKDTSVPPISSFEILVDNQKAEITSIDIKNNLVTLGLASRIYPNQSASLSYNSRNNDPLEDFDNQNAPSINGYQLANNTETSDLIEPVPLQAVFNGNSMVTWYFNEVLDNNNPDKDNFTILFDGEKQPIQDVTLNGNTVNIDFFRTKNNPQTMSLSYEKTNNPLRDQSYNELSEFSYFPIEESFVTPLTSIEPIKVPLSDDQNKDGVSDIMQDNVRTIISPSLPIPFTLEIDSNSCKLSGGSTVSSNPISNQSSFPFGLIHNGVSCSDSPEISITIPAHIETKDFSFGEFDISNKTFNDTDDLNLQTDHFSQDGLGYTRLSYTAKPNNSFVGISVDPNSSQAFIDNIKAQLEKYILVNLNQGIEDDSETLAPVNVSIADKTPPLPIQSYQSNSSQIIIKFSEDIQSDNLSPKNFILTDQNNTAYTVTSTEIDKQSVVLGVEELLTDNSYTVAYTGNTIHDSYQNYVSFFSNLPVYKEQINSIVPAPTAYSHNKGDGNGDGLPDSDQLNVVTIINPFTNTSITIESDGDTCNQSQYASLIDLEDSGYSDPGYVYPIGLIKTEFTCNQPGQTANFNIYLPFTFDTTNWTYRKLNYITGEFEDVMETLNVSFQTVALENGPNKGSEVTKISFAITDGSQYDADGQVNGRILDPSGPAILASLVEVITVKSLLEPGIMKAQKESVLAEASVLTTTNIPESIQEEITTEFILNPIVDISIPEEYKNLFLDIPGLKFSASDNINIDTSPSNPRFDLPVNLISDTAIDSIFTNMPEPPRSLLCEKLPRYTLDRGDYNNEDVAWVQRTANLFGADLYVDSNYGRRTKKAVLKIQKSLGFFLPLGNWSERTWTAISEKLRCTQL